MNQDTTLLKKRLSNYSQSIREFLFGMVGMEFTEHALEMRASVESLFMLAIVGDMIGVPIMPPYYSLRLLPFIIPNIATWRRRVLREREFSEVLPWDHLDSGLDKDWLWEDWQDSLNGVEVEDCRWTPCFDCGVCPQMGTDIEVGPTGKQLLPLTAIDAGVESLRA
jgi:hypothetical protein